MWSYGQGSYQGSKRHAAVYCGSVGQLLWATLQCHPCSLVVAVSKAIICNLLLPKTSWLLCLPNVKYWPLHSSCLVTHEWDCDVEPIWFFAQHLLWQNSCVEEYYSMPMVSVTKFSTLTWSTYKLKSPDSSMFRWSSGGYFFSLFATLFVSFTTASKFTDAASPCLQNSFRLYLSQRVSWPNNICTSLTAHVLRKFWH